MRNKVILVGAINEGNTPTCGETMKNQLFVKRFNELFDAVITVDTLNWKKRPWVLVRLFFTLLFNRGAKVVISASTISAYFVIKFLYHIRLKKNVFYWVVGGSLHNMVKEGKIKTNHMRYLKAILVQGTIMCKELQNAGLDNVVYVPNSKYIDYLPSKSHNLPQDKIHFVFLSRISPYKGCEYIFESVKELNKLYAEKFDVTFYGRIESGYDSFLSSVESFDNVKYNGVLNLLSERLGYEELAKYDVMLFPTYWDGEGFPGVVIDAYISSLPIIATDWNLNTDVIEDGKDGWIIPVHNVDALIAAMKNVIEHPETLINKVNHIRNKALQYDCRNILTQALFKQLGLLK